jgi:hypothetical protein
MSSSSVKSATNAVLAFKALPPTDVVDALCAAERNFDIHIRQRTEMTLSYSSIEHLTEQVRASPHFPPENETTLTEAAFHAMSAGEYLEQVVWLEKDPSYVGYYYWKVKCEKAGFSLANMFRKNFTYVLLKTHVNFGVMK